MTLMSMPNKLCTRILIGLWCLIFILIPLYFFLTDYWPKHKAQQYYRFVANRINDPERGGLRFFVERQRRTTYELSRSLYMHNLISYMQGRSEITEQQIHKMESFIKSYQQYFGYKQVFLLDRKGTFVFSTIPGVRRKNINDVEYKDSPMVDSFKLSTMTLVSDITPYIFDPIVKQKALFITMPVFFEGKLNGFLVAQIDSEQVEALLTKDIYRETSGEYLIVQRVGQTITFVVPPVGNPTLTLSVRPETSRDFGAPVERAALGYEGHGVTIDYRGVQVAGAWYFMPQYNWGFVWKTDYTQVVRYIRWMGYSIIFLALLALILTMLCMWRLGRKKPGIENVTPPTHQSP